MKKRIFIFLSLLGMLSFTARYYYLKYAVYQYGEFIKKEKLFSVNTGDSTPLTPEETLLIGDEFIRTTFPKSSYRYFSLKKKPGVIRVGIFGCSMVAGDETAPGHDIASFLNERFKRAGINNVEVLNFGLPARGVHQMYLLWQFCAGRYELDHSIFFPFYWHRFRDSSFRWADLCYPPIYARYIIKKDSLLLIPPSGKNPSEIYKKYFRFIPPFRYLRYDTKIPFSFKIFLPISLHNKPSPFYYRFSPIRRILAQEIKQTYEIIFSRIKKESPLSLIIANDEYISGLANKELKLVKSAVPGLISSFLYTTPLGHTSALGNQLRAEELFWRLNGKTGYDLFTWEIAGYATESSPKELPPIPLREYKNLAAYAGNYRVASFITYQPITRFGITCQDFKPQESGTFSLLLLPDTRKERENFSPALMIKNKPVTARFCPLDFALTDKDKLKLILSSPDGKKEEIILGVIYASCSVIGRLELEPKISIPAGITEAHFDFVNGLIFITAHNFLLPEGLILGEHKIPLRTNFWQKTSRLLTWLIFKKINYGVEIDKALLKDGAKYVYLRPGEGDFIDIFDNRQNLTLDIKTTTKKGEEYRIPFFLLAKKRYHHLLK